MAGGEPSRRDTGLVNSASALEDLLRAHRDGLAPPALVTGHRDVVARDLGRFAFAVAKREEPVVARGVVRGMLLPRLPLLARRAPSQCYQGSTDHQQPPSPATHPSASRHIKSRDLS